jgi:hypothetical protein
MNLGVADVVRPRFGETWSASEWSSDPEDGVDERPTAEVVAVNGGVKPYWLEVELIDAGGVWCGIMVPGAGELSSRFRYCAKSLVWANV